MASTITNGATKAESQLGQILKSGGNAVNILKPGDLVSAKLIRRSKKGAFFDLGSFGTGIAYAGEMINAQEAVKNLKPGDATTVKIVDSENEDGYVEISLRDVGRQKAWQEVKDFKESGEILTIKVAGANSGGLMTDVSQLKAFLPVSQLSSEHFPKVDDGDKAKILEELKKFVGQELKVKVIDVNPRSNKLILSERETVSENIKELLEKYKAGDVVDGLISGVADFGAFLQFADNPKIEGLIHISELSHRLVENPKEVVKVGDAVKAKITEIKDGRVSLSLKALQGNPWDAVENKYKVGETHSGTVLRFNPYGAFISLDADITGLIHVSEFGGVEEMKKKIEQGKSYDFTVDQVKSAEKRIILKLKK